METGISFLVHLSNYFCLLGVSVALNKRTAELESSREYWPSEAFGPMSAVLAMQLRALIPCMVHVMQVM